MKLLIDENMSGHLLVSRLQAAGHEPITAASAGLNSLPDPVVFRWAILQTLPILTRDHEDFTHLHHLIEAAGGRHWGILLVRFDGVHRHTMNERVITAALSKLETSNVTIAGQIHVLNQWR